MFYEKTPGKLGEQLWHREMRKQAQVKVQGSWALSKILLTRKSPLAFTVPGPGW